MWTVVLNHRFKDAMKKNIMMRKEFEREKKVFCSDVKSFFLDNYNMKVDVVFFSKGLEENFNVDPYFTDEIPRLSVQILYVFCTKFGCEYISNDEYAGKYIFCFDKE